MRWPRFQMISNNWSRKYSILISLGNGSLSCSTSTCPNFNNNVENLASVYLSQPIVSKALNADIQWNSMSNSFNYTQDAVNMLKYYAHVLKAKPSVRILIYSGLSDIFTVPFTYSMPCVNTLSIMMKAKITTPWKLWSSNPDHHSGIIHEVFIEFLDDRSSILFNLFYLIFRSLATMVQ